MNRCGLVAGIFGSLLAGAANADLVVDFNNGSLGSRATFDVIDIGGGNSQLQITLENLAPDAVSVPVEVLTGLWFNLPDPTLLDRSSGNVVLTGGSSILNPDEADQPAAGADGLDSSGGVTGEFGMETGGDVTALRAASNVVIANAGLDDLVGTDDLFPGDNLDDPTAPDGFNYGIITTDGLAADANDPLKNEPLIQGGVVITVDYLGALSLSDITGVAFNYGTDVNAVIPIPGGAALAFVGLGLLGVARRRFA